MTPQDLVNDLAARGVSLKLRGDSIEINGPWDTLPGFLKMRFNVARPAVVQLLRAEQTPREVFVQVRERPADCADSPDVPRWLCVYCKRRPEIGELCGCDPREAPDPFTELRRQQAGRDFQERTGRKVRSRRDA